ncbi:unnamed protein product [Trichobilharzia szidati]|nr:unnamed protein product [Trichobilharzia szidati]
MFEQNTRDSEAKKEALQNLSNSENEARAEIRAIRNENYTLKVKLRQQLVQTEETIKQLKRQHELDVRDYCQSVIIPQHLYLTFVRLQYTSTGH